MAKVSMIQRDLKRQKVVEKYAESRKELKEIIRSPKSSAQQKEEAQSKLQKMPRNASHTRLRNRCAISGRPRGYYRQFGLARIKLREAAMSGDIPGLKKASW